MTDAKDVARGKCYNCLRFADDCVLIDIRWGKHPKNWYLAHRVCGDCRKHLLGSWRYASGIEADHAD